MAPETTSLQLASHRALIRVRSRAKLPAGGPRSVIRDPEVRQLPGGALKLRTVVEGISSRIAERAW